MISQLILELSSAKIFDGGYQDDYHAYFVKIGKSYPKLLDDWSKSKKNKPVLK
jgi:hypothetical protein